MSKFKLRTEYAGIKVTYEIPEDKAESFMAGINELIKNATSPSIDKPDNLDAIAE